MSASGSQLRKLWLVIADTVIIYASIILAMHIRLGLAGSENELSNRDGWIKIGFATAICVLNLYFYDLYDYVVMTNRRELLLRLVQALGIAWVLLAIVFYFAPPVMIGRGVSVISVPLVLVFLLLWRNCIHILTGHPDIGEKILVVGTGPTALDTAEAVWRRRDAGYRIVGFVSENGAKPREKIGRSEVLGKAWELEEVIKNERIDRVVIAVRERRGAFPTEALLKMSLAGDISIEECTSFFERITGKVHVDIFAAFVAHLRRTKSRIAHQRAVPRAYLSYIGAGWPGHLCSGRDRNGDPDQARITRPGVLPAGTCRQERPDL